MKAIYTTLLAMVVALAARGQQTVGLFQQDTASKPGYVLFGSMFGKETYLIDKCGKQIHSWTSNFTAGVSAYLFPDGSLLRPGNKGNTVFNFAGTGGIIERLSWTGLPVWSYTISSATQCQHHDVYPMPNGNVLAIAWELHDTADAAANGRNGAAYPGPVWSEVIMELQPSGPGGAVKVWEWHAWDHLVQEYDAGRQNFGSIADHPELIDLNYIGHNTPGNPDWLHINSVTYNASLDQIMVCSYFFDELWIIDHSTTSREAAGHMGGRRGVGGDLLYRWGNSQAYRRPSPMDHQLFSPHNPQWIPEGYPGAGNITIFNNGAARPEGKFSSVLEIVPPVDSQGNYPQQQTGPFPPQHPSWEYRAPNPTDFFSATISGAQRLPGGHTLITEGVKGNLFEVDSAGNILWRYVSPAGATGPYVQGNIPSQNYVFRATQYDAGFPGFAGKTLSPGAPLELSPLSYNCFFATTVTPTAAGGVAKASATTIVNPVSGNELRVRPGQDWQGTQISLLNVLGQRCASWTADGRSGDWLKLPLPATVGTGHYTLHVVSGNGERSSMTVVRE